MATYNITSLDTIADVNALVLNSGDEVLFEKGTTWNDSSILCQSNGVKYGAYGSGANPIITGKKTLTGFSVFSGNIYSVAFTDVADLNILYFDGVNTPMGKSPNYTIDSHTTTTQIVSSDTNSAVEDWTGAEIVIRVNRFLIERRAVSSHSGSAINYTGTTEVTDGYKFFFQKDTKALTSDGDWYHDGSTLYIYSSDAITNHTIQVPGFINLVDMNGKTGVEITDIDFSGANEHLIYDDTSAGGNSVHDCTIDMAGKDGIMAKATISAPQVSYYNNTITNCNNNGISVSDNFTFALRYLNSITNCGVLVGMAPERYGDNAGTSIGLLSNASTTVDYLNTVTNVGYHGIVVNGRNSSVYTNTVDTFCTIKDDGGGIYTYNGSGQSQIRLSIMNNVVKNGIGAGEMTDGGYFAHGIYMDDDSHNYLVQGNLVQDCTKYGIYAHNSYDSFIRSNKVYNCERQIMMIRDSNGSQDITGMHISYNYLVCGSDDQYCFAFRNNSATFYSFGTMDYNTYSRPTVGTGVDLIYVRKGFGGYNYKTLAEWKTDSSMDANSVETSFYIGTSNDVLVASNDTDSEVTTTLSKSYINKDGELITSYTLPKYSSDIFVNADTLNDLYIDEYTGINYTKETGSWRIKQIADSDINNLLDYNLDTRLYNYFEKTIGASTEFVFNIDGYSVGQYIKFNIWADPNAGVGVVPTFSLSSGVLNKISYASNYDPALGTNIEVGLTITETGADYVIYITSA